MIDTRVHKVIAPGLLRPYISLMFLECTSDGEQYAFTKRACQAAAARSSVDVARVNARLCAP